MRKFYFLFLAIAVTAIGYAQAPQKMSYQAVIRNSSDVLVTNHAVGMKISILQGSSTGTPVFVETQTPTTNSNGLITIEIGGGTPVTGTFTGIDWSVGTYFIKTETDPTGGTSYTITGASQLLSVPYSLYAKTSESSSDAVKLTGNQTITGNKTFSGTTTVVTPVNATDAATKAYVDALLDKIQQLQAEIGISDIDGNHYNAVKIGTQVWMSENLKTTKYNDGTAIPNVTVDVTWAALTTGAYSDYSNAPVNSTIYGRLYNWYAVDNNAATKVASNGGKNVCPTSWHVPTDAEWTTLTTYLGGETVAGGKLKETGTTHWTTPNTGATNETGFTVLPGGDRNDYGFFNNYVGYYGFWWSSLEYSTSDAYFWSMFYDLSNAGRSRNYKLYGFSVRCLRDL